MSVRGRNPVGPAILLVCATLLTACTSTAEPVAPVPLDASQRLAVFAREADARWSRLVAFYPTAVRPEIPVIRVIETEQWAPVMASCLTDAGFPVSVDAEGSLVYGGGVTVPSDLAVAQFTCWASYPESSSLDYILSQSERDALYDYYVSFLQPCLNAAMQPTPSMPTQRDFIASSYFDSWWSPYSIVSTNEYTAQVLGQLEKRCPPEPEWLVERRALG